MLQVLLLFFYYIIYVFDNTATGTIEIFPEHLVTTLHGNATFTCVYRDSGTSYVVTHFEWFANESILVDLDRNVEIQFHQTPQAGHLTFTNLSVEYNMTRIHCLAIFESGNNLTSDDSLFLIQGLPNFIP